MNKQANTLLIAVALALAATGVAHADGDGGDNSMSMWTGESYAAFHRGEVGDFYTDPREIAGDEANPTTESETLVAAPSHEYLKRTNPFRDDTAA